MCKPQARREHQGLSDRIVLGCLRGGASTPSTTQTLTEGLPRAKALVRAEETRRATEDNGPRTHRPGAASPSCRHKCDRRREEWTGSRGQSCQGPRARIPRAPCQLARALRHGCCCHPSITSQPHPCIWAKGQDEQRRVLREHSDRCQPSPGVLPGGETRLPGSHSSVACVAFARAGGVASFLRLHLPSSPSRGSGRPTLLLTGLQQQSTGSSRGSSRCTSGTGAGDPCLPAALAEGLGQIHHLRPSGRRG